MNVELKYVSEAAARAYGRVEDATYVAPSYGSLHAAAFDLRAIIDAPMTILPGEQVMIGTGIAVNMQTLRDRMTPDHMRFAAIILPRSGRGAKEGLCIGNTVGLIDEDYQGEITFCAWARPTNGHVNIANARLGGTPIHIEPGERIGQLMFVPAFRPDFAIVREFSTTTERGAKGYGSSGIA